MPLRRNTRPAPAFPTHLAGPPGRSGGSPAPEGCRRGSFSPNFPSAPRASSKDGVQANACPGQARHLQTRPGRYDRTLQTPAGVVHAGDCTACTHKRSKKDNHGINSHFQPAHGGCPNPSPSIHPCIHPSPYLAPRSRGGWPPGRPGRGAPPSAAGIPVPARSGPLSPPAPSPWPGQRGSVAEPRSFPVLPVPAPSHLRARSGAPARRSGCAEGGGARGCARTGRAEALHGPAEGRGAGGALLSSRGRLGAAASTPGVGGGRGRGWGWGEGAAPAACDRMRAGARSKPRGKGAGEAGSHPPQNRPPFASSARAPCAQSRGHRRTPMLERTRARPHRQQRQPRTVAPPPRTPGHGRRGSRGCAGRTPPYPWLSHLQTVPVGLIPTHTPSGLWAIRTIFREPANAGSGSPMPDEGD